MILRLALEAMGTRFELVLDGEDEFFLRAAAEAALQDIREQHDRLSIFSRGSLLSLVNARALSEPVPIDADLFALLGLCRRVWRDSDGAFDPAIGGLMHRFGFRGDAPESAAPVEAHGFAAVELDEDRGTVRFHAPGVALDLGGVAKGWALDGAAETLRHAGVSTALIHGGTSSAVAIGSPPGRPGWIVEIPSHRDDAPALLCTLDNAALGVSSPLGRTTIHDGATIGHVFDPRTGRPAAEILVAAVVCSSAAEADAWSTAFVVAGIPTATMPRDLSRAVLPAAGSGWTVQPSESSVFRARRGAGDQGEMCHGWQ